VRLRRAVKLSLSLAESTPRESNASGSVLGGGSEQCFRMFDMRFAVFAVIRFLR
jgi:hypothetical protein